jgi:nitronate monooxygenase
VPTHTISTPLTESFGIDVPIVQAPIGSATCPELAAGVANAGGLGTLAITWRTPEETRAVIQETRQYTDAPIGVNIVVDENAKTVTTTDHLTVCAEEAIDIVSFSFGDCAPYVDRVHGFDGHVLQTVGSAEEAERAVDAGVDSVVAQGWEAGGHIQSDVASMPLVPRVVDAVDVPVIAAGGIADGRGIAAALVLGADGVWLGTRFLATKETHVHDQYREQVLGADETETYFGQLFEEGWPDVPHRVLRNSTVEQWNAAGCPPRGERPNEDESVASDADDVPVERYADSLATPDMEGDVEALPLYAGQSTGQVETAPSATTVVETLVEETHAALTRADTLSLGDDNL